MAKKTKPKKPYPDFPLTPHPAGVWAKRIKGHLYYFGPWADPEAALAKYLRERDFRQAGQEPPAENEIRLTMAQLCDQFLEAKDAKVQTGKLSRRMHFDYQRSCKALVKIVGRNTIVEAIRQRDFDRYAVKLAAGVSLGTFANRVRLARILFRFASESDLIPKRLKFGEVFVIPDKSELRIEQKKKPPKEFTAEELRRIIDKAKLPLRAMILLGLNCGLGQNDCASLPRQCVDLDGAWLDFARPKTGIDRQSPLWPETVAALRTVFATRPDPKDAANIDLVFITKYGAPYVRLNEKGTNIDGIAGEFAKVLKDLKLNGNRRAFYSLRRTFQSIGSEMKDETCVSHIMGHGPKEGDMSATYRQHVSRKNLEAVTNYVHAWLWPAEKTGDEKQDKKE